jgi:ABC-type dipeptide/oligopeptide/nickel transport system ATPase subunit
MSEKTSIQFKRIVNQCYVLSLLAESGCGNTAILIAAAITPPVAKVI